MVPAVLEDESAEQRRYLGGASGGENRRNTTSITTCIGEGEEMSMFKTEADVMIATAGRVDDTNNEVQSELGRLRGVVDGVRSSWVGQAQVSFDGLMNRWDSSARQLQEALGSISTNIRSNAHNFDDMEAQNAQAFTSVGGQGLAL